MNNLLNISISINNEYKHVVVVSEQTFTDDDDNDI